MSSRTGAKGTEDSSGQKVRSVFTFQQPTFHINSKSSVELSRLFKVENHIRNCPSFDIQWLHRSWRQYLWRSHGSLWFRNWNSSKIRGQVGCHGRPEDGGRGRGDDPWRLGISSQDPCERCGHCSRYSFSKGCWKLSIWCSNRECFWGNLNSQCRLCMHCQVSLFLVW